MLESSGGFDFLRGGGGFGSGGGYSRLAAFETYFSFRDFERLAEGEGEDFIDAFGILMRRRGDSGQREDDGSKRVEENSL